MFKLRWSEKKEPVGTIYYKDKNYPRQLGEYTDAYGNVWDVVGIFYNHKTGFWIQAVPISMLHPYYSDTSTLCYSRVSQRWEPYELEQIKGNTIL